MIQPTTAAQEFAAQPAPLHSGSELSALDRKMNTTLGVSKVHHLWFVLFLILSLPFFGGYLVALAKLSLRDDKSSHVLLIPIISATLLYLQRRSVFANPRYCFWMSVPFWASGLALFYLSQT